MDKSQLNCSNTKFGSNVRHTIIAGTQISLLVEVDSLGSSLLKK